MWPHSDEQRGNEEQQVVDATAQSQDEEAANRNCAGEEELSSHGFSMFSGPGSVSRRAAFMRRRPSQMSSGVAILRMAVSHPPGRMPKAVPANRRPHFQHLLETVVANILRIMRKPSSK